ERNAPMSSHAFFTRTGVAALATAAVFLAGCASQPPVQQSNGAASIMPRLDLEVQFANDAVRTQLGSLGLTRPLGEYWGASVSRDWLARYRLEELQRPVEEQFYVSYHQAAWQLLELRVEEVDASSAPERVKISLRARFRNPERPEHVHETQLQDLWTKKGDR